MVGCPGAASAPARPTLHFQTSTGAWPSRSTRFGWLPPATPHDAQASTGTRPSRWTPTSLSPTAVLRVPANFGFPSPVSSARASTGTRPSRWTMPPPPVLALLTDCCCCRPKLASRARRRALGRDRADGHLLQPHPPLWLRPGPAPLPGGELTRCHAAVWRCWLGRATRSAQWPGPAPLARGEQGTVLSPFESLLSCGWGWGGGRAAGRCAAAWPCAAPWWSGQGSAQLPPAAAARWAAAAPEQLPPGGLLARPSSCCLPGSWAAAGAALTAPPPPAPLLHCLLQLRNVPMLPRDRDLASSGLGAIA